MAQAKNSQGNSHRHEMSLVRGDIRQMIVNLFDLMKEGEPIQKDLSRYTTRKIKRTDTVLKCTPRCLICHYTYIWIAIIPGAKYYADHNAVCVSIF